MCSYITKSSDAAAHRDEHRDDVGEDLADGVDVLEQRADGVARGRLRGDDGPRPGREAARERDRGLALEGPPDEGRQQI